MKKLLGCQTAATNGPNKSAANPNLKTTLPCNTANYG